MLRRLAMVACAVMLGCGGSPPEPAHPDNQPPTAASSANGTQELPPKDTVRFAVPVDGAPARGAAHPLVTIVVFSDFQCPFCSRSRETLDRLLHAYPDRLRVVFRNHPMPFHEHALAAAEAAAEARAQKGDAGFWAMHDLLFDDQDALDADDLKARAARIGLDVDQFDEALRDHRHARAILDDQALAIGLDVRGTPGHFIDGRPLMGAQPYEEFDRIVRQEIALAEKKMAEGTPRDALYATLTRDAIPPEPVEVPQSVLDEITGVRRFIPVEGSPVRGKADALVTLVEFGDFECPFCARVQPTLDALRDKYGDDLRIVFKHFPLPFHEHASAAAEAASEARAQKGDAGFWAMHDRIYEDNSRLDREALEADAKALGLDMRKFRKALDRRTHQEAISDDVALGQKVGVQGTPTFFINGAQLVGGQPLEAFEAEVDEALDQARALVARGVARKDVYRRVTEGGAGTSP